MTRIVQTLLCQGLLLTGLLISSSHAIAQNYPTRTVTLVVPFSPGASNDIFGRYLAAKLSETWKQAVVVENRPGAGSVIGTAHVAKAKPDGLTLLLVSSTLTTNAATRTDLPFEPLKDLQPVGLVALGQMVVVTGSRIPMASLQELVKQAKAQTVFYGTAGVGSSPTFSAELLNDVAGIRMQAVHYKGGTEALLDLSGGRIDVYVGTLTTLLPMITSKTVTAVAVASQTRSGTLPEVPTVAEAGFPGAESDIWWGVFAPAGLPGDVTAKINKDIDATMTMPEARDFLVKHGATPATMSVGQFTSHVASELVRWKDLARKHNITSD